MRMWMVNTTILCRQHLLGEHCECHMFLGALKKRKSMTGYFDINAFEPMSLLIRHNVLAIEMNLRGYFHNSPLILPDGVFDYLTEAERSFKINKDRACSLLIGRCGECKAWHDAYKKVDIEL